MTKDDVQMKGKKNGSNLTPGMNAIAAVGPETQQVINAFWTGDPPPLLMRQFEDESLKKIAAALENGWKDDQAALVVSAYLKAVTGGRSLDPAAVARWILSHANKNDAAAVADCISVEPPDEISIIRVLSRAGSQKLVFLATWRLTQRQVVLKKFGGTPEVNKKVVEREAQSHPLSIGHPNIIETHFLRNKVGEVFLVEERLPMFLTTVGVRMGFRRPRTFFLILQRR